MGSGVWSGHGPGRLPQSAGDIVVVRRVEGTLPPPARVHHEQLGPDGARRGHGRAVGHARDGCDEGVVVGVHQEADGVPTARAHLGLLRDYNTVQLRTEGRKVGD